MDTSYAEDKTCLSGPPSCSTQHWHPYLGCVVGAHYRITQHLGSGGMGHVFLAESIQTNAKVAVKILAEGADPAHVRMFANETALLLRQDHPNIVRALGSGELAGTPYLMMEYVRGLNLAEWLAYDDFRTPSRVLYILAQVAAAMEHLHAQGILHRDIKPANIMLDERDDSVKLIDLGIALHEQASSAENNRNLVGTPAYMAPEQVLGGCCTRISDVYALAALALELLTGAPPHAIGPAVSVLDAVLHGSPTPPSARGVIIPGLDAFFERALSRHPACRFQAPRTLIGELAEVLHAVRGAPRLSRRDGYTTAPAARGGAASFAATCQQ